MFNCNIQRCRGTGQIGQGGRVNGGQRKGQGGAEPYERAYLSQVQDVELVTLEVEGRVELEDPTILVGRRHGNVWGLRVSQ